MAQWQEHSPLTSATRVRLPGWEVCELGLWSLSDIGDFLVLPSKRLLGMCRCMGSYFHNWTDYNGVTFSELLEWGGKFSGFLG